MFNLAYYENTSLYSGYSILLKNPGEYYENGPEPTNYCLLDIKFGKYFWSWHIPEFFKPQKKWVDLSHYDWCDSDQKGYWEYIPHEYGIAIVDDNIYISYGIQPGCWSATDKKNSDHSKLIEIPWKHKTFIHTAFWSPEWSFCDLVKPMNSGRLNFDRLEMARESVPKIKFRFNDFDGEEVIATCYISEHRYEHGIGWFKWLKYFLKPMVIYELDIEFNRGIGYDKKSWKGGITWDSININFNDDPIKAFKRYASETESYRSNGKRCRNFTNIEVLK